MVADHQSRHRQGGVIATKLVLDFGFLPMADAPVDDRRGSFRGQADAAVRQHRGS
jgi:hypothetical protein